MQRFFTVLSVAVLTVGICFHLDAQQNRRSRTAKIMKLNEKTIREWAEVQAQLKEKDPKGYEEIVKLSATNLVQAYAKMQEIAVKQKIELPSSAPRSGRGDRSGRNGGFGGPGPGMPDGPGMGGRGGMRGPGMPGGQRAEAENQIKAKFPKEYAAYKTSVEKNRTDLVDLAKKAEVKLPPSMSDFAAVRAKYEKELSGLDREASMKKFRELMEKEGYTMGEMRGGFPSQMRRSTVPPKRNTEKAMQAKKIKNQFPAEWKAYLDLRKKDPAAAEKMFDELVRKIK